MSHFTTIKTKLAEKELLLQALKDLGYTPELDSKEVRGFGGKKTPVEIRVPTGRMSYAIGFRKIGDCYEVVADWWGVRSVKQEDFLARLTQRYAYRATRRSLEAQGFTIAEEKVGEDQQIHLVLQRTV
jgi:hypothetical protein